MKFFQSLSWLFLVLGVSGCAGFDLARLAPPGVVRYERIADEKEANPEIARQVEERRETRRARFPKIGETPAGGAKMTPIPNQEGPASIARLESERDLLKVATDTDKLETGLVEDGSDLEEIAGTLNAKVDEDKRKAKDERKEDLSAGADN